MEENYKIIIKLGSYFIGRRTDTNKFFLAQNLPGCFRIIIK